MSISTKNVCANTWREQPQRWVLAKMGTDVSIPEEWNSLHAHFLFAAYFMHFFLPSSFVRFGSFFLLLFLLNNSIFSQPASTHIHRQTVTRHTAHHSHVRIPNSTLTWSGFCLRHENPYSNVHNGASHGVYVCVCSGWLAHWCDVDAAFLSVTERCSNSI